MILKVYLNNIIEKIILFLLDLNEMLKNQLKYNYNSKMVLPIYAKKQSIFFLILILY